MSNSDSLAKLLQSGAEPLSRLLNLDQPDQPDWRPDDLQGMLRHQLDAPLAYDLRLARPGPQQLPVLDAGLAQAARLGIRTLHDLFANPEPPVELLRSVKDLFKHRSGGNSQRRPEQQVAYVLYLLAIVTAENRLHNRITRLSPVEVARGSRWAAGQEWVDSGTREMLRRAEDIKG